MKPEPDSVTSIPQQRNAVSDDHPLVLRTTVTITTTLLPPRQTPASRVISTSNDLHEIIPFTTTTRSGGKKTRLAAPSPDEVIKPILEVTCADHTRLFWSDFKITWRTAWNDQYRCQKLFHALNRRGLITGWKCLQVADNSGYIMQAKGHRPRSPRSLVADAIRESFESENTLYYRGYEMGLLCN